MHKKILSFLLCVILLITAFSFSASAKQIFLGDITIDDVSGVPGDSVIVPISIENNPGIMAVTISITYDSSALEYEKYYRGTVLTNYLVVAHPDKNIIRYVNCQTSDRTQNGVILSLQFKIKDSAKARKYKIDIDYTSGDFCNWNLDRIMPNVTEGSVDVVFTGTNCPHDKYSEWIVAAEPSCEEVGSEKRLCELCSHTQLRDIAPIGHEFSENWTVDIPAKPETPGKMSRHCIRCEESVDEITFEYEQIKDGNIDNRPDAPVEKDDFILDIFKEQNPGKELTENKPSKEENRDGSDSSSILDILTGSDSEKDKESILSKITEVFPNFESILKIFKTAIITLLVLLI